MKKSFKIVAVLAVVATLFSGCITATVLLSKAASDEKKEITSGKVFEIEQATVEFANGDILAFKDYGKYIRVDKANGDFLIITPSTAYEGSYQTLTYREQKNTDGTFYYSDVSYVFPENWFRFEKFADDVLGDVTSHEGYETVAGKSCVSFSDIDYEVAGYKRIYMYKEENGRIVRRALNMNGGCNAEFKVPEGFTKKSGSIDYGERF
jgi:hypothetical protein